MPPTLHVPSVAHPRLCCEVSGMAADGHPAAPARIHALVFSARGWEQPLRPLAIGPRPSESRFGSQNPRQTLQDASLFPLPRNTMLLVAQSTNRQAPITTDAYTTGRA